MKLYKNVDIVDLESILKSGILSMNASGNNNWINENRVNNSNDVVYLFEALTEMNTFTNYGAALLEVEVEDAERHELQDGDFNKGKYTEYIISKVTPDQIKAIYVPSIFKDYIQIPVSVLEKITWCEMQAKTYSEESGEYISCTEDILKRFAETAQVEDTKEFNFFRGKSEDRTVIDLSEVKYITNK